MRKRVGKTKRSRVACEILEGLTELAAAVQSGVALDQRFSVRTVALVVAPEELTGEQIRVLRQGLGASQAIFAAVLGVTADAVQAWEQGRNPPRGASLRMLHIFREHPELFRQQIRLKPRGAAA